MSNNKAHFIGVGGIGMSSLAQYYLAKGWRVSGSDLVKSEMTDFLEKEGIEISIGHRALNLLQKVDRVIFSAAVQEDNPEMEQARVFGGAILSYAQALGELTRQYITLAVSGAHGKSTTTALLALMLIKAGLDPTVIIGTKLKELGGPLGGGNFRFGKSRYLIVEADEYNKSFLYFYPTIAVITNIDREHLDTYGNLDGVINTFAQYFKNVANIGALIINDRDINSEQALKIWSTPTRATVDKQPKVIKYGLTKISRWPLKVVGEFNQLNAEAAWQAAKLMGVSKESALKAVSGYSGSWRRMEELIPKQSAIREIRGVKFFTDYAHHPTEIKATVSALKEFFPKKKIVVVFQPHQLERLNYLFDDFISAFNGADKLILLPTYEVIGREGISQKDSKDLFEAIGKNKDVLYLRNVQKTLKIIKEIPNAIVVYMGAGDIDSEVKKYFKSKLF